MSLATGAKLGRYEIRSKLGEGGMGEVYLAQDVKLDRTVAIKVLPTNLANDQSRMRRFVQEARTASSLSHPNVAHIYEIDDSDGVHFIAMEYIDGETLRHRISHTEMPLHDVLEIAMQVAAALSAAHAAGITHRDIKPDNVMLRPDGYVKVLDFGLAKLTDRSVATDQEAPTRAMVNTDPGTVMGTVAYMSPEQARGQATDARTDIWSLGVAIYQMVTHHLPFEGSSNSDVIASILGKEPPPLARYARDVPEALEWIVTKALTKDPDERYQTAKEMMVDLRRIKQKLDAQSEIERSSAPQTFSAASGISSPTQTISAHSVSQPAATSTVGVSTPAISSAEFIASEIKRHKVGIVVVAALVIVVALGAGFWIYKLISSNKPRTAPQLKFTRLTNGGKVGNESISGGATISPDGRYVSFATLDEQGRASVFVRQVVTNSVVRVFGPAESSNGWGITFSPDGEYVYIPWVDKGNPDGALFKVPVLGGTPQKILESIGSSVAFSPDGKRITYVRAIAATGESWLLIANADGSDTPQVISKRKLPDYYSQTGPAWSPDGKKIAVSVSTIPDNNQATVVEVPVTGGKERAIAPPQWSIVNHVVWLNDGSGLVTTILPNPTSFAAQVWFISYPDGAARPITNDLNQYGTMSLGVTADSKTIATVQEEDSRTIWIANPGQDASAHEVSKGSYEGYRMAPAPDGRIVYSDLNGTTDDMWIMKPDGSDKKQLTNDSSIKIVNAVTPDGRYIIFFSDRNGGINLWRMDLDGNNKQQITSGENSTFWAAASADSKQVVFSALRNGKFALLREPIEGGTPTILWDHQCTWPSVSPDGTSILCLAHDEKSGYSFEAAIIPFAGGPPSKTLDLPSTAVTDWGLRFSPDGKSITYVDASSGAGNICNQPLDGGPRKQLTNFKSDYLADFNWTRDGKLIFGRGPTVTDVILIKDFR